MSYLLDTDWLIDYLRGRARAVELVEQHKEAGLAISAITYAEYYEGVVLMPRRTEHLRVLDDFVAGVGLLPVDRDVARIFGEQRAQLRAGGRLIDNFDLLIAATALRFGLTLLTRNVRDFGRIEGLEINQN